MPVARVSLTVGYPFAVSLCLASLLTFAKPAAMGQTALLKRLDQTNKWTSDEGSKSVPATDVPLLASPPLAAGDRRLVRWCLARYGSWGVPEGGEAAEKSAEQAARRFFDAMPRDEIAQRLVPLRKALYRGTRAYTSVAFVLAYYDIDFESNARRVVEAIAHEAEPSAKLKAAGFTWQGEDPSGAEGVADAVATLYRRHHSAAMLRAYLHAPTDGHLTDDWEATVGSLFLAYPTNVLRTASTPQDMKSLAEGVYQGVDDNSKIWSILRRLEHSSSPQTVRLARRLRRAIAAQPKTE